MIYIGIKNDMMCRAILYIYIYVFILLYITMMMFKKYIHTIHTSTMAYYSYVRTMQ